MSESGGLHRVAVLGLDLGTSVIKTVAFDERGRILALAARDHAFAMPQPGWAECDMEAVWSTAAATLREVVFKLQGIRIESIGVCGNMGGAWLADAAGAPVRPAILWNDGRASGVLARWQQEGLLDQVFETSCNMPVPGFSLPLLAWLGEHEPANLDRSHTLFFSKDWIRFKLTGERCTEETDASHIPGDVRSRDYSMELLDTLGLRHVERLLLPLVESGDVAGCVHPRAAAETGLPVGTPVVAGLADVSATLTGAGALKVGCASAIVGTSNLNSLTVERPLFEPHNVGFSFLLPNQLWTRTLPNQTGTIALTWWARLLAPSTLGEPIDFASLEREAQEAPLGARGLIFHPYLNSTGVSAPIYEPRARGRLWGLGVGHGRTDVLRAVYEGVAMAMADCFDHLPPFDGPINLMGGGARSPFWRQMFADATGKNVVLPQQEELGALGVAMLAGVATGIWSNLDDAHDACCTTNGYLEPDPDRHTEYRKILRMYQRLRRDLVDELAYGGPA